MSKGMDRKKEGKKKPTRHWKESGPPREKEASQGLSANAPAASTRPDARVVRRPASASTAHEISDMAAISSRQRCRRFPRRPRHVRGQDQIRISGSSNGFVVPRRLLGQDSIPAPPSRPVLSAAASAPPSTNAPEPY